MKHTFQTLKQNSASPSLPLRQQSSFFLGTMSTTTQPEQQEVINFQAVTFNPLSASVGLI